MAPGLEKEKNLIPAPKSPSEAYQNRKKGRRVHKDSLGDLERILKFIENQGETTPGSIGKELGISRSTLTYFLKRILELPDLKNRPYRYNGLDNYMSHLLAGKRFEKLGAGRNVRYRIVPDKPGEPGAAP